MKRKGMALLTAVLFTVSFCGCATVPKDALTWGPETMAQRQMQTRKFATNDEKKILSACAGLLQDMGFNIDESETKLGVITASKTRDARTVGDFFTSALLTSILLVPIYPDDKQTMRASVVTRLFGEQGENMTVRVTFQRIVWDLNGRITRQERVGDAEMYKEFFDKLSKAIFLEGQEI
jgi:hypothetical protein